MATRSFVVFRDTEPSEALPSTTSKAAKATPALLTRSLEPTVFHDHHKDKENLHPITGALYSSTSGKQPKLLTKSGSKSGHSPDKVRTVLSAKPINKKVDSKKEKKKGQTSKTSRKKSAALSVLEEQPPLHALPNGILPSRIPTAKNSTSKPRTRLPKMDTPSLPPVPEVPSQAVAIETATITADEQTISSTDVDAKCYDLTVSPLAEISDAFLTQTFLPKNSGNNLEEGLASSLARLASGDPPPGGNEPVAAADFVLDGYFVGSLTQMASDKQTAPGNYIKTTDSDPVLGDCFVPTLSTSTSNGPIQEFSTPERRLIYAAFTFQTPEIDALTHAKTLATAY